MNFLIPELVERVDFHKGLYYANQGDFSSAGAANIVYFDELPETLVQAEGGMFGYGRGVFASSHAIGPGTLLYAGELFHNNGPWQHSDDYWKGNALLRYSAGDDEFGGSLTGSGYYGDWDASDQIAKRALQQLDDFDRFSSLDKTTGGESQKYMLYGEWHRLSDASASQALVYGFYQDLDLFSNFTYFLDDPVNGDQFEQQDERWVGGASASHISFGALFQRPMENTLGFQLRSDSIQNGLFQTTRREHDSTTRRDEVFELSLAPYFENRLEWTSWLRSVAGVRVDAFLFDVDGNTQNANSVSDVIASPKGSLVFGPWAQTELYLSGGMGFHSNDARGVAARLDSADPLVRTVGAEVGARTTLVPGLQSTLAVWWLDLDSELVFVGDAGETEATRPSRRYGVELTNFYDVTDWLTLDADFSFSHAQYTDNDDETHGDHIPGSIETVIASGISVHDLAGFFGALRLRYLGERPLIEDDSARSDDTVLLSTRIGYEINQTFTVSAEVFNLLDDTDHEIDYFYESRLQNEGAGTEDIHFHPVDPISFRAALTARF
jgi:hypothetical protein